MAKINPTDLYVSLTHVFLQSDMNNPNTWEDLYTLVADLRNIFCCVVCQNILSGPLTPCGTDCQHHVCTNCKGGSKNIKQNCQCKEDCYYAENKGLERLMQCYKGLCVSILTSELLDHLQKQEGKPFLSAVSGIVYDPGDLIMLLIEGALFQDDYNLSFDKLKSVYINANEPRSILQATNISDDIPTVSNDVPPLHSLPCTDLDNTISNRHTQQEAPTAMEALINTFTHKKITRKVSICTTVQLGCRCGNATVVPGNLTCCGQRCQCYVDRKPCYECKCRGCRNPLQLNGQEMQLNTEPNVTVLDDFILQPPLQSEIQSQTQAQVEQQQLYYQIEELQQQQELEQQLLQQQQHLLEQQRQNMMQQEMLQQQELQMQMLQQQQLQQLQEQQLQELQQTEQFEFPVEYNNEINIEDDLLDWNRSYTLQQLSDHLIISNAKALQTFPMSPELQAAYPASLMNELESDMSEI